MREIIEEQIEKLKDMEAGADTEFMKGYVLGSIEAYEMLLDIVEEGN
ncbi:hypothetical protein [Bacillus toyonensis]|nr:hypothetical protein [Bacillus toyonensis]